MGAQDNPRDGQVGHRPSSITTPYSPSLDTCPLPPNPLRPAHRPPVREPPRPWSSAAGLVFVEGLVLLLFGITEVVTLDSDRLTMGVTVSVFFMGYGALLVLCSWGLNRVRAWARGPVLLAQLVQLGLAWNFRAARRCRWPSGWPWSPSWPSRAADPRSIDALERAADRDGPAALADLGHREPQPLQRAVQQPGDVHLRDTELRGDLALGLPPKKRSSRIVFSRGGSSRSAA